MIDPKWKSDGRIKEILRKPGRRWSAQEQTEVVEWIFETAQYQTLLASTFRRVRDYGVSTTDVEEAWGEFCVSQIYSVIKSYDPTSAKGVDFWAYLKFCFRRSCIRRFVRFNRPKQKIGSLDEVNEEGESAALRELEAEEVGRFLRGAPTGSSPLKDFELTNRVNDCIRKLPPHYATVLVMKDKEGRTIEEIAHAIGKTTGYVKGTLSRAREWFRDLYEGRR